jgi:hypothetical protein
MKALDFHEDWELLGDPEAFAKDRDGNKGKGSDNGIDDIVNNHIQKSFQSWFVCSFEQIKLD